MKVLTVIDGDTFEMLGKKGRRYRLRLDGCDCPEMGQPYGQEAKDAVRELMQGKWVKVRLLGRDKYRRYLGKVHLADGRNLSKVLLRAGLAYPMPGKWSLLSLRARMSRSGVWGLWLRQAPWHAKTRKSRFWGWVSWRMRTRKRKLAQKSARR